MDGPSVEEASHHKTTQQIEQLTLAIQDLQRRVEALEGRFGKFPTEEVRDYIDGTKAVAAHGSREMPVWGSFFRRLGNEDTVTYRVVTLANYVASARAK